MRTILIRRDLFQTELRFKRQSYLPVMSILSGKPPNYVDGINTGGLGPDPFNNPQGGFFDPRVFGGR